MALAQRFNDGGRSKYKMLNKSQTESLGVTLAEQFLQEMTHLSCYISPSWNKRPTNPQIIDGEPTLYWNMYYPNHLLCHPWAHNYARNEQQLQLPTNHPKLLTF